MNKNFNIGEILVKAWQITWKHKVLWLFGILISITQVFNLANNEIRIAAQGDIVPSEVLFKLFSLGNGYVFWLIFLGVMCFSMIFLIASSSFGQIAIIKGAAIADQSEEKLSFGQLFKTSQPYFWRVLGFSLMIGFLFLFIFMILVGILYGGLFLVASSRTIETASQSASILGLLLLCMLPFLCLFLIVFITILSPIMMQTIIAMIVDDLNIPSAIAKAWQVIKQNIGPIILIVVLIYFISSPIGFVLAAPSLIAVLPLIALAGGSNFLQTSVWIALLCLCAYTPVLVFLESVFTVYIHSVWTLTYLRLTAPAPVETDQQSNLPEPVDVS